MNIKKPDSSPASNIWERNYQDCAAKLQLIMEINKKFFEKVFSTKRMERYFALYPNDEARAIKHYECNLMLSESLYTNLSLLEVTTPSKIVAELTLGFWVSLLNSEYERTLWQALRRAFPYMPRQERKRRNVSAPLNLFRHFRNRIFHNESICWNLNRVEEIHAEILKVIGWMNRDLPEWVREQEHFCRVCREIRNKMEWK